MRERLPKSVVLLRSKPKFSLLESYKMYSLILCIVALLWQYTDGLMDELDLLIIGGYFGEGRRKTNVSHFLLGVAVPPSEPGKSPLLVSSINLISLHRVY